MNYKKKSWIWMLTWPFAHANYTTIWDTIYKPSYHNPSPSTIKHEMIHSRQQHDWGWFLLPVWIFCYLLVLPILWNPFRYKWEMEAYTKGSGYTKKQAKLILGSAAYGWLL